MDDEARRQAFETARLLERQGHLEDALNAYVRAQSHEHVVRLLVQKERFGEAGRYLLQQLRIRELASVASLDAEGKKLAFKAAICLARGQETETAIELFVGLGEQARAIDLLKRSGQHEAVARLLAESGPRSAAPVGTPLRRITSTGPMTVQVAQNLERSGQAESALEAYAQLKEFRHAARLAHKLGRAGLAAEFFTKAGRFYEAAVCFADSGDKGSAIDSLLRLSREDPRYRKACVHLARLAHELGVLDFKLENFVAPFLRVEPQDDDELTAFYELGRLYEKHDFPENARMVLEKVCQKNPGFRDAADLLVGLGRQASPLEHHDRRIVREDGQFLNRAAESDVARQPTLHRVVAPGPLAPGRLAPGAVIGGRYRIDRQIGEGGIAVVFRAHDTQLEEDIALKVLKESIQDAEVLARFRREAAVARRLTHPHIVRVYDFGTHETLRYISMELLSGRDLHGELASVLPVDRAVEYLVQACAGLGYAHAQGVVHRDVKPENLFLTDEGVLKVADFGIAKRLAVSGVTMAGFIAGTPHYMPPEQIQGQEVGPTADLYALGVIAYQMVTGRLPFVHDDLVTLLMKHITDAPVPPRQILPALPQALDEIILQLLEKEPSRRLQSCEELARRLRAAI